MQELWRIAKGRTERLAFRSNADRMRRTKHRLPRNVRQKQYRLVRLDHDLQLIVAVHYNMGARQVWIYQTGGCMVWILKILAIPNQRSKTGQAQTDNY